MEKTVKKKEGMSSTQQSALAWGVCLAYGFIALVWFADYARRVTGGADRASLRRSIAGGAAAFMAFTGAAMVLMFSAAIHGVISPHSL